jgi:hypothetical protein
MDTLLLLKSLLGTPSDSDIVLQFYLDMAGAIICELRDSTVVETKYLTHQVQMAVELYNKRGAEGQIQHEENGIKRVYSSADISKELLSKIIPVAKTPYSTTRIVE